MIEDQSPSEQQTKMTEEPRLLTPKEDAMLLLQGESIAATKRLFEEQEANRDLHYTATHDDLTDTLNRRGLMELIDESQFNKVLFADGTNVKAVNDYYGHDRGDEAIVGLAEALRKSIRPDGDLICRLGGDEFVVVLLNDEARSDEPVKVQDQFHAVEARVGENVEAFLDDNPDLKDIGMHVAVGSAVWRPGEHFDKVRSRAERNMYEVKKQQHEELGQHRNSN